MGLAPRHGGTKFRTRTPTVRTSRIPAPTGLHRGRRACFCLGRTWLAQWKAFLRAGMTRFPVRRASFFGGKTPIPAGSARLRLPRIHLPPPKTHLLPPWTHLSPPWTHLSPPWTHLSSPWIHLPAPWTHLPAPWTHLPPPVTLVRLPITLRQGTDRLFVLRFQAARNVNRLKAGLQTRRADYAALVVSAFLRGFRCAPPTATVVAGATRQMTASHQSVCGYGRHGRSPITSHPSFDGSFEMKARFVGR